MIYIPKWPTLHEFKCVYSVARGKHLLLSVSFRIDTRSPSVAEGNWNDVSSFARKICEWIPRLHLLNHKQIKDTGVQYNVRHRYFFRWGSADTRLNKSSGLFIAPTYHLLLTCITCKYANNFHRRARIVPK